jgi:hypothetical protein
VVAITSEDTHAQESKSKSKSERERERESSHTYPAVRVSEESVVVLQP